MFWYLSNIKLRPSECVAILQIFHNQQFDFDSDEYCILLAVLPTLLTMMNKLSHSPKQWFHDISRGRPCIVKFEQEGGFAKFGLNPVTFLEFLNALHICGLDFLDCAPSNFNEMCRFGPWSVELLRRRKLFHLEQFQSDTYLTTFQLPVTKFN